jgi:hypothetical protein
MRFETMNNNQFDNYISRLETLVDNARKDIKECESKKDWVNYDWKSDVTFYEGKIEEYMLAIQSLKNI